MREEREIIRELMCKHRLTNRWLINVFEMQEITTCNTELSSVFSGARKGPKANKLISMAYTVLTNYDQAIPMVLTFNSNMDKQS